MKTFIFTYNRYDTISTSLYFRGVPHTVLCHTQEQKEKFEAAGLVHGELIATGQPRGLAYNRNVALDMMQEGEWAAFWVDDLISVTTLKNPPQQSELGCTMDNQKEFRDRFKQPCIPEDFFRIAEETIKHAEEKGFALCGFALTGNPVFRNKHYSYWALADGRCWLVKKTDLRFDIKAQMIDDTCWTALNLQKFGGVVVNNWTLPLCERYTAGSFGSIKERMDQKIEECKYLVETYPDYITLADKPGWPYGSHVKIRQKRPKPAEEQAIKTNSLFGDLF